MSAAAPAASATPGAKVKKTRTKKEAKPKSHPSYTDMIKKALASLKDRKGSSRQAIAKYVRANFKFGADERVDVYVKTALRAGVKSGKFVHTTGAGASGSFTLPKKASPADQAAKPKAAKRSAKSPAKRKAPAKKAPAAAAASGDSAAPAKKARTPKKKAAPAKAKKAAPAKAKKAPAKAKKPRAPKKAAAAAKK